MKGTDFKPGRPLKQDDRFSYYRQPHWDKPKRLSGKRNNLVRVVAAVLIFILILALRETSNPWGVEAREKLKHVLTTDWNYQPLVERVVHFGLQMADMEWSLFSNPQPVISGMSGGLPLPVSGKVIRGYGMVIDPVDSMERFHAGIDIAAPVGSGVRAVLDGKVKRVGDSPVLGKYILIEHGPGNFTLYGGLSKANVEEDRLVQAGQVIGEAGTTGDIESGGVHFEMRENNKLVDPLTRLQINH